MLLGHGNRRLHAIDQPIHVGALRRATNRGGSRDEEVKIVELGHEQDRVVATTDELTCDLLAVRAVRRIRIVDERAAKLGEVLC